MRLLKNDATRRFVFVNRYFHPDCSGTSYLLTDLALALSRSGKEVHVVSCRHSVNDTELAFEKQETFKDVHIHRVWTTNFGRESLWGRVGDCATFFPSASAKLRELVRPGDVVVAKTDPPLISTIAATISRSSGARLVNWIQDLYPEVGLELVGRWLRYPCEWSLKSARNASLKAAAINVAIGDRMAERLWALGVPRNRVRIIPNWTDDDNVTPIPLEMNKLRREWDLHAKFVVCYSGNLGRAHEAWTLLNAAELLRSRRELCFLFIGGGQKLAAIKEAAKTRGLESLTFKPLQPRERLRESLGLADIHWLSLRSELEGFVVPSKFYGIAAAGRPIITIGDRDGELARQVLKHQCGAVLSEGDAEGLATTITKFADNAAMGEACGIRSRLMLEQHFSRASSLGKWEDLLSEVSAGTNF